MAKAIELKRKHTVVKEMMESSGNPSLQMHLSEIENEIRLQAKISGNEEVFLKEIWQVKE